MSISTKDFNQVQQEANEILIKLESLDSLEWAKKKDLIETFVIKNRILLDNDKLRLTNKKDFCSFITQTLNKRNITINRNGNFYRLFNDDEKGDQGIDQKSINISSTQTAAQEYASRKEVRIYKEDSITELLNYIRKCDGIANRLIDAIEEKYNDPNYEEEISSYFDNLVPFVSKWTEINAVLTLARNEIDDRNKYGDYEKIIAQYLLEVGETTANLSRILGYCSKYGSIGIQRSTEVTEYRQYLRKCPNCEKDIAHELDMEIQRYKSGKDLKHLTPLSGY